MRYVTIINHKSRGRVAPIQQVIYYRDVPNARHDISNLCCHNWFYGNQSKSSIFLVYLAGSSPCSLCRQLTRCLLQPIFLLPPLTFPLLLFSVTRSPRCCSYLFSHSPLAYCLFKFPLPRHAPLPHFVEPFHAPLLFSTLKRHPRMLCCC